MDKDRDIYLVRHLPTEMNISGGFMGREFDPPIVDQEIEGFQEKITALMPSMSLDSVSFYSSPALRCRQTSEILQKTLNIGDSYIKLVPDLVETDFGEATGLTVKQIREKFPEVHEAWINDMSRVAYPGGETYQQVQERAWNALQEIIRETKDDSSVFICSHVDVIKMTLFKAFEIPISQKKFFVIPNGGICTLVLQSNELKFKPYR
ncbi:MAG: Phosphoglycerate mutase [Candidatus Woesebacteria bacterium GW2011_GWB1_38_5b]|uniref:Phosphoglycerate mutase n=1 Tax=Candidatus Woesebacteria bacterium GW2011_GWB1_38_5b TaxID=1618569 RepID=A0A0G0K9Y1_9BACT|nr:MAG: Phosphoglycerate mutase [Candidatus Woesebacteria bacterium GW2011_GWB1_38_5b]